MCIVTVLSSFRLVFSCDIHHLQFITIETVSKLGT